MSFDKINVFYTADSHNESEVGTLLLSENTTYFQYSDEWMQKQIELAPIHLKISKKNHQFATSSMAHQTIGLCSDSLPDGWGMLIMDRYFRHKGVPLHEITPLQRLSYMGNNTMGALAYRPASDSSKNIISTLDVAAIANEAFNLYEGNIEHAGELLRQIAGSPGGARPKALIGLSQDNKHFISSNNDLPEGYAHCLIKFSDKKTNEHEGVLEHIHMLMAEKCGIAVPAHFLVKDSIGINHLVQKRFDRRGNNRIHTATATGLLHVSNKLPLLDYEDLIKLSWMITRSEKQVVEQFKRAVFNYYSMNCDDHGKNHSYVLNNKNEWELSPAYDITFTTGHNNQHFTSYMGKGNNVTENDFMKLAKIASIDGKKATDIIDATKSVIADYHKLVKEFDLPKRTYSAIKDNLNSLIKENPSRK